MSPKVDSAAMVDLSGDVAFEIANHLLLKKLEIMSSIDSLTGIKNRNMMNNRVDLIVSGKIPNPDAVLFIDLNGLKRVNDENTDNYFITKNSPIVSL